MKNSIGLVFAGLLVCCALLAAGCTGTGEDTTAAPSEINFGYQPSTHQVAYMLAMNKGWWSETLAPYGITVDKLSQPLQMGWTQRLLLRFRLRALILLCALTLTISLRQI